MYQITRPKGTYWAGPSLKHTPTAPYSASLWKTKYLGGLGMISYTCVGCFIGCRGVRKDRAGRDRLMISSQSQFS